MTKPFICPICIRPFYQDNLTDPNRCPHDYKDLAAFAHEINILAARAMTQLATAESIILQLEPIAPIRSAWTLVYSQLVKDYYDLLSERIKHDPQKSE